MQHYRRLGRLREEHAVFADGEFRVEVADGAVLAFSRKNEREHVLVVANMGHEDFVYYVDGKATDLLSMTPYCGVIPAESVLVLGIETTGGKQHGTLETANEK